MTDSDYVLAVFRAALMRRKMELEAAVFDPHMSCVHVRRVVYGVLRAKGWGDRRIMRATDWTEAVVTRSASELRHNAKMYDREIWNTLARLDPRVREVSAA